MPTIPSLSAADVEGRLDWLAVAEAIAAGHRGPRAQTGDLFLTRGADTLQARAAWVEGLGAAVKSFTVLAGNPARGLPSVQGALVLYDADTGAVEAVIDSALVTRWKTAADSLLGARLLARPDARRLLILGAGEVAASLVDAYRAGFPGIEVALWNRTPDRARGTRRGDRRRGRRRPRRRPSPRPTSSPPRPWRALRCSAATGSGPASTST